MKKIGLLMLVLLCAGCQMQRPAAPTVVPQVMPPVAPSATPECQAVPGVTLEVKRMSRTTVELTAKGLQPGEIPTVLYSTEMAGVGSARIEAGSFAKGADASGNFSVQLTGMAPLDGQTSAVWDVRLVHRSGVACVRVTMP